MSAMAIAHRGPGRKSALVFAVVMAAQSLVADRYKNDGLDYFIACFGFESLLIVILGSFSVGSRLSDVLCSLACFSFILNAFGALLWRFDFDLNIYYYMWTFIYLSSATTMLWEDGHHDKGRGPMHNIFRALRYPGCSIRLAIHGEAKR